mmetsp:Transcript_37267/g.93546  ORF Transcript_37267/g.93546 Transcript_37267/m.93546 type:complete len:216 (+) Transcript_37267:775-1422(+)
MPGAGEGLRARRELAGLRRIQALLLPLPRAHRGASHGCSECVFDLPLNVGVHGVDIHQVHGPNLLRGRLRRPVRAPLVAQDLRGEVEGLPVHGPEGASARLGLRVGARHLATTIVPLQRGEVARLELLVLVCMDDLDAITAFSKLHELLIGGPLASRHLRFPGEHAMPNDLCGLHVSGARHHHRSGAPLRLVLLAHLAQHSVLPARRVHRLGRCP